jgi:dolichyl-diphosphooligosaccharide--protein glycosyltransferase
MTWFVYSQHNPGWLAIVVYGWYFLFLSFVQLRFSGYFGVFNAILAGGGLVHFLGVIDLARPVDWMPARDKISQGSVQRLSLPSRQAGLYTVAVLLVVSSLGLFLLPTIQSGVTYSDDVYRSATFIGQYNDERPGDYPSNYVFNWWGDNRMYNYVVSGHSHSYHFVRHNHQSFLTSAAPDMWYDRLSERTGFIVTTDREGASGRELQTRLHDHYGSRTAEARALEHYRAIYTAPDGSPTVFVLVPGATVTGTGPENETFIVSTTISLPPDNTEITYEQRVSTDHQGQFEFTTPYPGTYEIGNTTVGIGEQLVERGGDRQVGTVEPG